MIEFSMEGGRQVWLLMSCESKSSALLPQTKSLHLLCWACINTVLGKKRRGPVLKT